MDIIQLYQDYSIEYHTEGHPHCREGWVNVECPHCTGNPGLHLGYNLEENFFSCWRCGWKPIDQTIAKLLNVPEREARQIIKRYGLLVSKPVEEQKVKVHVKAFKLPSGTMLLQEYHRRYLENRNFDPDYLVKVWGLLGTGPVSNLDKIDYKLRIIIPFIWGNELVSFDSRDITGKDPGRYKACPKDREIIAHKSILYGKQEAWKNTGILVEGPTDVWRLGTSSFACSGIKYTPEQVRVIPNYFKRIAVCFDDDPQAKIQANKIVAELKFRNVDAFRIDIKGDPGDMEQNEADYLVKQLIH